MRGKTPKNLRPGAPRVVNRLSLSENQNIDRPNNCKWHSYGRQGFIEVSPEASSRVVRALEYAVNKYSSETQKDRNLKIFEMLQEQVKTENKIRFDNTKPSYELAITPGWLGNMLQLAIQDKTAPHRIVVKRLYRNFCTSANEAVRPTPGIGITTDELQEMFVGFKEAVDNATMESEKALAQNDLTDYDKTRWNNVVRAAKSLNQGIKVLEYNCFGKKFEDNLDNLGWQLLSYSENGRWNKKVLIDNSLDSKGGSQVYNWKDNLGKMQKACNDLAEASIVDLGKSSLAQFRDERAALQRSLAELHRSL